VCIPKVGIFVRIFERRETYIRRRVLGYMSYGDELGILLGGKNVRDFKEINSMIKYNERRPGWLRSWFICPEERNILGLTIPSPFRGKGFISQMF